MKLFSYDDLSPSRNPPTKARSTSPHRTQTPITIPDTPSSSSHNTDLGDEKSQTITLPFPWATDRPATVHSLNYLLENEIVTITEQLQCKICKCDFKKYVDLRKRVKDVCEFIKKEEASMDDKAPEVWMKPEFKRCHWCWKEDGILKPLIEGTDTSDINWLFLFLTQWLGCCDLGQLNYFLKHNNITMFQSQDKQRVLYATYMALYKQILPDESLLRLI